MEVIPIEVLEKIKANCLIESSQESCGLIYMQNNKIKFYPCKNISTNPKRNFIIDPNDYEICEYKGEILSCYHSHLINYSFSSEDIERAFENNLSYLLYIKPRDKFYFFDIKKNNFLRKYLDIPFIYGKNDCWNLVLNFFKNEFSIIIEDPAPNRYMFPNEVIDVSIHLESFSKSGLNIVKDMRSLKVNDVLILDGYGTDIPTHFAIYLENDLILHNIYLKKTKIQALRKWHTKYLKYVLRHEKFA